MDIDKRYWLKGYRGSEHLHENLKPTPYLEGPHAHIDGLEVAETGVEEVQAGEIQEFHLVQVDHALLDFLVPAQVSLFLALDLFDELIALDGVVLAIQAHEIPIQRNRLSQGLFTMMSLGVILAFEYTSQ